MAVRPIEGPAFSYWFARTCRTGLQRVEVAAVDVEVLAALGAEGIAVNTVLRRCGRAVAPWRTVGYDLGVSDEPNGDDIPLIDLPKSLVWDYAEAPADPIWRLERLASRFPAVGRDRRTVRALFQVRHRLRLPLETLDLIEIYEEKWREREAGPCRPAT